MPRDRHTGKLNCAAVLILYFPGTRRAGAVRRRRGSWSRGGEPAPGSQVGPVVAGTRAQKSTSGAPWPREVAPAGSGRPRLAARRPEGASRRARFTPRYETTTSRTRAHREADEAIAWEHLGLCLARFSRTGIDSIGFSRFSLKNLAASSELVFSLRRREEGGTTVYASRAKTAATAKRFDVYF